MQKFVLLSLVWRLALVAMSSVEEQGPMTIAQKRSGDRAMDAGRKIGVLLTSHGDIDELEVEPYVRSAFLKNVGVPLPRFIREIIQDPAYWIAKDGIIEQYEIIGPTKYRGNAQLQADAIQDALLERGVDANIYLGYNFMPPFIEDAVDLARRDGVTDLIVFNKGAQFSLATLGESIERSKATWNMYPIGTSTWWRYVSSQTMSASESSSRRCSAMLRRIFPMCHLEMFACSSRPTVCHCA